MKLHSVGQLPMSSAHSMHKSPTPVRHSHMNQGRVRARSEERGKREEEKPKRKAGQQNMNYQRIEELKQGLPRHSSG